MKIVISSQIELPPSLFVRRCFDAFERNNNRLSSLINHAQLTSIETCHFFLSLSRLGIPADHPLRFPSKRGAAIAPKETEHRGDRGPSGNSIYRVLRFCSILPALSLSRRLLPSTHLFTLHPLSPCPRPVHGRASGRATLCTYSIHPRIGIVHESRPALLKNRFLSRERAAPQRKLQVNSL